MAKKSSKKKTTRKKAARTKSEPKLVKAPEPERRRAARIYKKLEAKYPDAHCALIHSNPFELLVATILSAQCTDNLVNQVTPGIFKKLPTPQLMAKADLATIEALVNRVNFWRNKAKNLKGMAQRLVEEHDGLVPQTMEELIQLPGAARKTANVVLGNAFNINHGVVVDTHVGRIAKRMGFTRHDDPKKIERDLMALFPRKNWTMLSHLLIYHGRAACKARHALCCDDDLCKRYCSNAKLIG
ncbi:MAG: endonuclease III [Planctomycetota bacterium]